MATAASLGRLGHLTLGGVSGSTDLLGLDAFTGTSGTALISHNSDAGFGSPGWGPLDNSFFQIAVGGQKATQTSNNGFVTKIKTNTNVVADQVTIFGDVKRPGSTAANMMTGILFRGSTAVGANDDHVRITVAPNASSPTTKAKILYELVKSNAVIQTSTVATGVDWATSGWGRLGMVLSSANCTPFREPYLGGVRTTYSAIVMSTGLNNASHRRAGLICRNYTGVQWDNITVVQTTNPMRIGEIRDYSLDILRPVIKATSLDSSGYDECVEADMAWSATINLLSVSANVPQTSLRKALLNQTLVGLSFQPTTGTQRYSGVGYIKAYEVLGATRDAVYLRIQAEGTRALTYTS